MNDKLDLKKHIRNVDDFPIPGIKFRDITSLIETPEPFRKTCKELTKITQDFSADLVVSIESRGFIFAGSVSTDLLLPFVLAKTNGRRRSVETDPAKINPLLSILTTKSAEKSCVILVNSLQVFLKGTFQKNL